MEKQQPLVGKRRTASASAASVKGRPQHSQSSVPLASQYLRWAGLRSPCAAAHAEESCATNLQGKGSVPGGVARPFTLLMPLKPITTCGWIGVSCWAVASRNATRIVISRM